MSIVTNGLGGNGLITRGLGGRIGALFTFSRALFRSSRGSRFAKATEAVFAGGGTDDFEGGSATDFAGVSEGDYDESRETDYRGRTP